MSDRLQKVMAHDGVASRRKSEELITTGHVKVNGKIANQLGITVDPSDRIEVDGQVIRTESPVYFVFNKPRGVITSANDEKDRKTVLDYLKRIPQRVYPIGRLDYDTNGILLLTNDGELAYKLTHPKFEIEKTYLVKVKGVPDRHDLDRLSKGIVIDHKYRSGKAKAVLLDSDRKGGNARIELTIHEGKNHEIKKMMMAIGHPVEKLKRLSFAGLQLGELETGDYRPLSEKELKKIKQLVE